MYLSLALVAVLAALQMADAYLTWRIVKNGGRELNPVVRFLINRLGLVPGLAVVKLILVVLASLFLLEHTLLLLAFIGLYAWVVVHNWKQLRKGAAA